MAEEAIRQMEKSSVPRNLVMGHNAYSLSGDFGFFGVRIFFLRFRCRVWAGEFRFRGE